MTLPPAPDNWYDSSPEQQNRLPELRWKLASEIQIRPINWIEPPLLLGDAFHLLTGVKNAGKGTWLANTAARVTRGELGPKTGVLWLGLGEDSYDVDVTPRLVAAGGELASVLVLESGDIRLPEQERALREKITSEVGMVVLDPLSGSLGVQKNSNNDWEVRPMLAALNRIANETQTMIFGVRHISIKAGNRGSGTLAGVLGSTDWINVPRMVLALLHDDVHPATRHIFTVAGNRGPDDQPGVMFQIEGVSIDGVSDAVTRIQVFGESLKDPDELLATKRPRAASKTSSARRLILMILRDTPGGEIESDVLDSDVARRVGMMARSVRDVRMTLNREGLTRAVPEKSPSGDVLTWRVKITNAGISELESPPGPGPLDHLTPQPTTSPTSLVVGSARARESHVFHDSGDLQAQHQLSVDFSYDSGGLQGNDNSNSEMTYDPGYDPGDFVSTNPSFESGSSPARVVTSEQTYDSGYDSGDLQGKFSLNPQNPEIVSTDAVSTEGYDVMTPQLPDDAPSWERQHWERRNGSQS